jgi:aspartyl-tRNA(Asn)/glutamyl-tRNA(Gln) amidotransferase subunit B
MFLKKGFKKAIILLSMTKYVPTIGLEIHAELKTKTKMFCDSINDPDETRPNVNVCPICMGHPGTLPTLNHEAIKLVLKIGHAINGQIADYTEWDRKNYFYPDIPKGYQISQYKYPLISGGKIAGVELTRIHLEEDTGTSIHDRGDYSLVNYNRAGLPLMELVTEPVIHSAKEASDFAKELQLLLRYMNASDANMEKGEMRVEANISIAPEGSDKLGTKVEVKNLNSFKVVEKAIEFEIDRMTKLLDEGRGDEIVQETRGFNEAKQKTFSQRKKETSDDYRYFPEPDLPKLKISEISEFAPEKLKAEIPELPWERRERFEKDGLSAEAVDFFVKNIEFSKYFDVVVEKLDDKKQVTLAANYLSSDLVSLIKEISKEKNDENADSADENESSKSISEILNKLDADQFVDMIKMTAGGEINSRGAKDILAVLVKTGGETRKIAEEKGLMQQSDTGALKEIAQKIIDDNSSVVEDFKNGKEAAMQFLIGQGMKETRGSANPQVLKEVFTELIR